MLTSGQVKSLRKLITEARKAAEKMAIIDDFGYGSERASTKESYERAEKRLQDALTRLTEKSE